MKKAISVFLAVLTLMSVFSLSFNSFAYYENEWVQEDGNWYYYDYDGEMLSGGVRYVYCDETYCYFDNDGALDKSKNGWYKWENSPNEYFWLYFKNGYAFKGWLKDGGKYYYLAPVMLKGGARETYDNGTYAVYFFNKDGTWNNKKNGWVKQKVGGEYEGYQTYWYYFKKGKAVTGWKKIDGYWYYFTPEMSTGIQYVSSSSKYYAFSGTGKWLSNKSGWYKSYGSWYYLKKGVAVEGWKKVDGKWYYLNPWMYGEGPHTIDGKSYYFNKDGSWMEKGGKWYLDSRGYWFYYKNGKLATGWQKIGGKWYYFDESMLHSGWAFIDGKWCYFNPDGTYNAKISSERN